MEPWPGLEKYQHNLVLPRSGIDLFFYQAGEDNPKSIVLLHGLGDEADTWRRLIEPLSQNCRVIAPDLPGFGRSAWLQADQSVQTRQFYQMSSFSAALLEMLEELSIPQAVWVGHSFGAMLAHAIALEHPEKVAGLVLVDGGLMTSTPRLELGILLYMLPGLGEWLYNRLRKDPQAAFESLLPYYANLEAFSQEERDFLFRRVNQRVLSDAHRHAFLSTLRSLAIYGMKEQRKLPERLARQRVPTLVIWGEKDQVTPVESAAALAKSIPAARLVTIPAAGHDVQQERPQELLQAILSDERLGF
jgi:pimeloyl-ACP methyl ester carboxylesterase